MLLSHNRPTSRAIITIRLLALSHLPSLHSPLIPINIVQEREPAHRDLLSLTESPLGTLGLSFIGSLVVIGLGARRTSGTGRRRVSSPTSLWRAALGLGLRILIVRVLEPGEGGLVLDI
jgi:hypothetical protein